MTAFKDADPFVGIRARPSKQTQQSTKQRLRSRLLSCLVSKLNLSIRRRKAVVWLLDTYTPCIREGGVETQRLVKSNGAAIGRSGSNFRPMVVDQRGRVLSGGRKTNRDFDSHVFHVPFQLLSYL